MKVKNLPVIQWTSSAIGPMKLFFHVWKICPTFGSYFSYMGGTLLASLSMPLTQWRNKTWLLSNLGSPCRINGRDACGSGSAATSGLGAISSTWSACSNPFVIPIPRFHRSLPHTLDVAPQDSSDHQDCCMFNRGFQPKPSFATVTGMRPHPTHTLLDPILLAFPPKKGVSNPTHLRSDFV